MVTLRYGDKMIVMITRSSRFLSAIDQKILLDGNFVLDTQVPVDVDEKIQKSYYIGVLFEIFQRNFEEFSKGEIYVMMLNAYPIFLKERQIQNHLAHYQKLKDKKDVFTSNW